MLSPPLYLPRSLVAVRARRRSGSAAHRRTRDALRAAGPACRALIPPSSAPTYLGGNSSRHRTACRRSAPRSRSARCPAALGLCATAPRTPKPPALVTAATTSRQWLKAQIGNSTPSISATLVRIRRRYAQRVGPSPSVESIERRAARCMDVRRGERPSGGQLATPSSSGTSRLRRIEATIRQAPIAVTSSMRTVLSPPNSRSHAAQLVRSPRRRARCRRWPRAPPARRARTRRIRPIAHAEQVFGRHAQPRGDPPVLGPLVVATGEPADAHDHQLAQPRSRAPCHSMVASRSLNTRASRGWLSSA